MRAPKISDTRGPSLFGLEGMKEGSIMELRDRQTERDRIHLGLLERTGWGQCDSRGRTQPLPICGWKLEKQISLPSHFLTCLTTGWRAKVSKQGIHRD